MLTVHPVKDRAEVLRRIIFLGGALIGCGKVCTCRAKLAMVITADHMTRVEALAADVQFGKLPGGVAAIREIIGESPNEIQQEVLAQIEATMQHPEYVRTKESGGQVAAESSLDQLIEQTVDPVGYAARRPLRMVEAAMSGDDSRLPAGVHMFRTNPDK